MRCPICSKKKIIIKYNKTLYDDRYGYRGLYSLLKCKNCLHTWLDANFSPQELESLYTDFYPRSELKVEDYKPSVPAEGFSAWLNGAKRSAYTHVPENVKVLDIGCGFCETLGYHSMRGCEVYGVEADANADKAAKQHNFKVHIGLFNHEMFQPEFFDYVTLDQVIEHAANPLEMLSGVSKILKKGGVAIISTPNSSGLFAKILGRFWLHWHVPYHLHQFSFNSMEFAAKKCGFIIERADTITPSDWIYYQQLHLFVRPSEGDPAAFWSTRGCCGFIAKIAVKFLTYFHKTKINHIVTRVIDTIKAGDNFLFFLRKL